ncbi:MAG: OmpA family protein [Deltaproteobacteria bacterium]|nr:OmpA family protein [Deltaproteobacteria bacterium]
MNKQWMQSISRTAVIALGLALLASTGCKPDYPRCENDEHCQARGEFCVNGMCQQCREASHCNACQQCAAGRCVAEAGCCQGDQDCAAGQRCRSGSCGAECLTQNECGPRQACQGGRCLAVDCLGDEDCAGGAHCVDFRCVGEPACGLGRIHFDFDEALLTSEARSTLDANARCLKIHQASALVVEGHCDERGTEEYNLSLGDRRARVAADYLKRLGIQGIRPVSYGEARPLSPGHDEQVWAANRRAEFVTR